MPKKNKKNPQLKSKKQSGTRRRFDLTKPVSSGSRSAIRQVIHEIQMPSAQARSRCHAIPLLFEGALNLRQISGRIGLDSWEGAGIGLRDISDGHVRRLKFEAGPITVELVAERRNDGWEYVARIYKKNDVAHEFVLEAGRRRILPHSDGFYLWTSNNLLRGIRLIALDRQIDFGGIQW